MTDTAEYWNDVKARTRRSKRVFTHVQGLECGHYHVQESVHANDIDCYACIKLIKAKINESN